jgi:hypothetical protein
VHATHPGDAESFWAGCGAVRAELFRRAGGFDERRYPRPQIEDIELGHRLRDLGARITIDPAVRSTHLKRWTLGRFVVASVRDRGVPWVELLLGDGGAGARGSTLNLGGREKLWTALAGAAAAAALTALATLDARWLLAAAGADAVVLVANLPLLRWLRREGGAPLALAGAPLRLLYYHLNGVSVVWGAIRYLRARLGDANRAAAPSRGRYVRP